MEQTLPYVQLQDFAILLIMQQFIVIPYGIGIAGHSFGENEALVLALRNPDLFRTVSAFAPICAASQCPRDVKTFSGYLGREKESWQ